MRNAIGFLFGLVAGVLLGLLLLSSAHADDAPAMKLPLGFDPAARSTTPRASFGVMHCGEVVAIWVVTQDGRVSRTDAEHHPDSAQEYNAFLEWLKTAQEDIYFIPCLESEKPKEK